MLDKRSITELIAGKRQGNIVSSLMENFDIARESLETSLNSEGSAMAEHEKWMESLEAKTQQFKAAWEELSQAFLDSSFLKGLVDAGTNVLSVITKIIDAFGTLPTLIGTVTAALSFKNVGELINQFQFLIVLRIEYAHEVFY
ncbi:MAG: phage tail tape measure protein [Ruminococcus sp.]|nr:phage tail tape measure protein [Ruminococcus sp.]